MDSPVGLAARKEGLLTRRDFIDEPWAQECRDLIKSYEEKQLTPVGYDFRAAECINLTLGHKVKLTGGVKYRIRHGDFVIVVTRETLDLLDKNYIFGQVYSKVSFAIQGLSHVGTKIDPGFAGPLVLSFKNEGYDIIEFTEDTAICNVALEIISPTDAKYSRRSFEYPTLTERPNLPFPLAKENWDQLSRWYSKEDFDAYLQWSDELTKLRTYTLAQHAELETKLTGKLAQDTSKLETGVAALNTDWTKFQTDITTQAKEFEGRLGKEVSKNLTRAEGIYDRAERLYSGAILTVFVAAVAVIGVLISAAALFVNELNVRVQGDGIFVSKTFLYVGAGFSLVVFAIVIGAIVISLKGNRAPLDSARPSA